MIYSSAISCDRCNTMRLSHTINKTLFKKILRQQGWSFGKQDLCPNCKAEALCKSLGIDYYIQDGLREEMNK